MPSMDTKVYVGDLGSSGNKADLEDAFSKYGRLTSVWVARNPPGFAFVEFEDPRDAEDAVRALDGRTICGRRVRVEMSTHGQRGSSRYGGGGGGGGGGYGRAHPDDKCYQCGERGHFARDCRGYGRGRRERSYSRSRSRSPRRRSRSYSNDRDRRRTRSRSPRRCSRSHSRGDRRSRSYSRSPRRSLDRRSRSPVANGRSRSPTDDGR